MVVDVAVLVTLDSKGAEGRFLCAALVRAGVRPWIVDLSMRPHDTAGAHVRGDEVAGAADTTWAALAGLGRAEAGETMIAGGIKVLLDKFQRGEIAGVIGVGGANGTTIECAMMRALPPLFPKVMVSPVAGTAAIQWYVAESDIAMFPTIGDISLNRITRAVMENAAQAIAGMARARAAAAAAAPVAADPPLIGVSSFGNLQPCVDRVSERLAAAGYEVIHFHSSGPGGMALESLAGLGELAGVIDVTTSELADLLAGGVYNAGDGRLRAAGAAGLPQVVVPGALDMINFWVGEVPERYRGREFHQYNVEILLMRTNAEELATLGEMMAERLNAATGPFAVLIPARGFSQITAFPTHDIDGRETGAWRQPATDRAFTDSLRRHLSRTDAIEELDLHINDPEFADACVDAFLAMMRDRN